MKILITGHNGFIGRHFMFHCIKSGLEVKGLDLPESILDNEMLLRKINDVDFVVHFAAVSNLNESIDDQDKNFDVNILATYKIAKICAARKIKLIFISTCCAYGNTIDSTQNESTTYPNCKEPYATSKMAGEYIIKGLPNLEYCILRIGTTYGPGQRSALFTAIVFDKLAKGETIWVHGDGTQTRQLIYISDLVSGIYAALERFPNGEIINLCGREKVSAIDTIRTAEKITGNKADIKFVDQRFGQIFHENISIQKAIDLLGWEPKIDFFSGMMDTYYGTFEWHKI